MLKIDLFYLFEFGSQFDYVYIILYNMLFVKYYFIFFEINLNLYTLSIAKDINVKIVIAPTQLIIECIISYIILLGV